MNQLLSPARPGAFRLFLAFVVLASHSSRFDLGPWAVYCFFTLSGYWIHRMWGREYAHTDRPFRVFYVSRLLRILPAFWLMNLVATGVLHAGLTPPVAGDQSPPAPWTQAVGSNIFLLGFALLPWAQSGLRVAWSLDIELQFYLLFPLLLLACHRPRSGSVVFGLLLLAAAAGTVAYVLPVAEPPRTLAAFGLFFLAGTAAAEWDWQPTTSWAAASLLATTAIVAGCWVTPEGRLLFENGKHGYNEAFAHWKRGAELGLALISVPFVLGTVRRPSDAFDRACGALSFALYLVHWPVMMVHTWFFGELPPVERLPSLLAAWGVVAGLSWLLYRSFDGPLERWRKRWVASHQAVG